MKTLALIICWAAIGTAIANDVDGWLREWPREATVNEKIPAELVREIPHSLFDSAARLLTDKSLVAVGHKYFAGFQYSCPKSMNAYLVRALYEHPSNGTFEAYRFGDALLVRHYALGQKSALQRSALIICLSFVPREIFVATGGAM